VNKVVFVDIMKHVVWNDGYFSRHGTNELIVGDAEVKDILEYQNMLE
jgi:hypothetical protein